MQELTHTHSFRLWLLLALTFAFQAKAEVTGLTEGRNQKTGQIVMTDLWGKNPLVEINLREKLNLLGTTFQLGLDGKNLEAWLVISIIDSAGHNALKDTPGSISVQVRSSTNESSPKNILGQYRSMVIADTNDPPDQFYLQGDSHFESFSPAKTTLLVKEVLAAGKVLRIYRIHFNISLSEKLNRMPEFISIYSGMCSELDIWNWKLAHNKIPYTTLKTQNLSSSLARQQGSEATNQIVKTNATVIMPAVQLSISRENGCLLITFSPAVAGAALEEANPTSFPWVWEPAVAETNQLTNGWYVSPIEPARVYRVKINP